MLMAVADGTRLRKAEGDVGADGTRMQRGEKPQTVTQKILSFLNDAGSSPLCYFPQILFNDLSGLLALSFPPLVEKSTIYHTRFPQWTLKLVHKTISPSKRLGGY